MDQLGRRSLTLRSLQAFAEVIRRGSATAAGRQLGLSQSAISKLIATLEGELGFELFWRDKGRLIATKEAEAIYDEVDLALSAMERVHSLADDIEAFNAGTIRLIAPPSFVESIAPDIVARFLKRHPRVSVSIDTRSIGTTKTMVATRVADCAFMKMPVDHPDLHAEVVVSNRSVCVLQKSHPLAKEECLTPELLKGYPFIALGTGRPYGEEIKQTFAARGIRLSIVAETHTVGTACALAARGIGIAILNELLVQPHLKKSLVTRPFDPKIMHHYAFVTVTNVRSPLISAFKSEVKDYFGA